MKKFIMIGVFALFFAGCGGSSSTLDGAISQVEKALARVEANQGNLSPEEWKALEVELETPLKVINAALENNEVGVSGTIKVISLLGKWAAVATKYGVSQMEKEVGSSLDTFGKELEKVVQGLEESTQKLVKSSENPE